jgi:hypothetical protein
MVRRCAMANDTLISQSSESRVDAAWKYLTNDPRFRVYTQEAGDCFKAAPVLNAIRLASEQLPKSVLDQEFDYKKLHEIFDSLKKLDRHSPMDRTEVRYGIYGKGGFLGDVVFHDHREVRFYKDNYPGPKVYRASNIPYRTYRQFLYDLERIGFSNIAIKEVSNG